MNIYYFNTYFILLFLHCGLKSQKQRTQTIFFTLYLGVRPNSPLGHFDVEQRNGSWSNILQLFLFHIGDIAFLPFSAATQCC